MSFPSSSVSVQQPALIRSGSGGNVHIQRKRKSTVDGGHNEWISSGHVCPAGCWAVERTRASGRGLGSGFFFGNTVQGPSLCCWWEEGSFGPER